jgi:pyruvate/2-oxoglutarate dehydrogenase complex dihydrolipoamide acyltransferase (E2) component
MGHQTQVKNSKKMMITISRLIARRCSRAFATHSLPVPSLGDSISDGTLVEFLKEPGQSVETDEIVAVIETDKVSIDIRSPFAGTVTSLLANADDTVIVGQGLMTLDSDVVATVDSNAATSNDAAASSSLPETPTSTSPSPSPASASQPSSAPPPSLSATFSPTHSHDRQPLIRFRHGDRTTIDAHRAPAVSAAATVYASDEDFLALPFLHRRLPMTEEEMDLINMGGASDEYDVDVKLRYV